MSIRYRIPPEVLAEHFVYRGWFCGLVPVYVGPLGAASPLVATRNGIPDFALDLVEALFAGFCFVAACLVHDFEPTFPLSITGRLDGLPIAKGEL